jgi:hypothetical protein
LGDVLAFSKSQKCFDCFVRLELTHGTYFVAEVNLSIDSLCSHVAAILGHQYSTSKCLELKQIDDDDRRRKLRGFVVLVALINQYNWARTPHFTSRACEFDSAACFFCRSVRHTPERR